MLPRTLGARGWGHLLPAPPGLGCLAGAPPFWFTLGNTSGTSFSDLQVSYTPHCLFPFLELFHVDGHSTRPRSPRPSAHSRARAVKQTMLMQHPNKWANWSILGTRGRWCSSLLHLLDPREQPASHPAGEQSHRQGLYHVLGTREPQGCPG